MPLDAEICNRAAAGTYTIPFAVEAIILSDMSITWGISKRLVRRFQKVAIGENAVFCDGHRAGHHAGIGLDDQVIMSDAAWGSVGGALKVEFAKIDAGPQIDEHAGVLKYGERPIEGI